MGSLEMAKLLALVGEGIKVLRQRGVEVTDEQAEERANNIVAGLLGNYLVVELPAEPVGEPDWRTVLEFPKVTELRELYAQGKPQGHGHSCACRDCKVFNQTRRAQ